MFDHEFVGATTLEDLANGTAKGPCRKPYTYFPLGECGICRPLFMHAAGTASILNCHQVRYCVRSIARFGRCCSGLRLITSFLDLEDLVPVWPSNQVGFPPQQIYFSSFAQILLLGTKFLSSRSSNCPAVGTNEFGQVASQQYSNHI